MKKNACLLLPLLLTSCGNNQIPTNDPYYCKGYRAGGWAIAYPTLVFDGELVQSGKNITFVNRTINEHGFHGLLDDNTEIYIDKDTTITQKELKKRKVTKVYALFNPNSHRITGVNDVKWIHVTSGSMPKVLSKLYVDFDFKQAETSSYIDETI